MITNWHVLVDTHMLPLTFYENFYFKTLQSQNESVFWNLVKIFWNFIDSWIGLLILAEPNKIWNVRLKYSNQIVAISKIDYRFFWACYLLLSAAIFFFLIFQTTEKFLAKRTFVRIADKGIPIGDIPFPAVTICSESLIFKIWTSSDYER